ncbi:MAG: hypothetical protein JNM31_04100 [Flavobacteriales bacterium]|nr:hypothetical protein [Flavobacteriales bacterium]
MNEAWYRRSGKRALDGGYLICGETNAVGMIDAFLIKTDSLGNEEWLQTYGSLDRREGVISVDLVPGGGHFLGGRKEGAPGSYDQWIQRLDSMGDLIWENTYGIIYNDPSGAHLQTLADGNCVFASA